MTTREIERRRAYFVRSHYEYKMTFWADYEYNRLKYIMYKPKTGGTMKYYQKSTYNDVIIMGDTETSRKRSR